MRNRSTLRSHAQEIEAGRHRRSGFGLQVPQDLATAGWQGSAQERTHATAGSVEDFDGDLSRLRQRDVHRAHGRSWIWRGPGHLELRRGRWWSDLVRNGRETRERLTPEPAQDREA